jgi:hypothetical protein
LLLEPLLRLFARFKELCGKLKCSKICGEWRAIDDVSVEQVLRLCRTVLYQCSHCIRHTRIKEKLTIKIAQDDDFLEASYNCHNCTSIAKVYTLSVNFATSSTFRLGPILWLAFSRGGPKIETNTNCPYQQEKARLW